MQRRLKKPVVYSLYAIGFIFLFGMIYLIESSLFNNDFVEEGDFVNKTVFDNEVPVVTTAEVLIRPYIGEDIKIVKNYYDYKSESDKQQNSIIFYENTYFQNSGVSYGGNADFDVVAIYDGTVTSVKEDDLLGKIVEIRHENDMISIYQSLSEVSVEENSLIKQGDIIGKSGSCNIEKELNSHLHFELVINGQVVNPEEYYDKKISEI